ncbi:PAS domain-containing sensor histidine kinase [Halorubrum tropicale]|uniref:histidine kinase n=1 Tax=Halorubrum tropicale TaxID=1765655 RepID=A0A0N0U9G1_9EURY|nr:PAS domain-containing sensor histidine kinase [Halorubrum tropicale]KOX93283.1 histidine kinase [Halorubrum tropicale]
MSSPECGTLSPVLDTLHTGVAIYDAASGAVIDANARLEEILGYSSDQLRDLSVAEYTANTYPHTESEFHSRLSRAANGSPQQFVWRAKRADGELIWIQLFTSRQRPTANHCVHVEVRDITHHYDTHHRAELFWRVLRHNLRNEAAIIIGCTEQAMNASESGPSEEVISTIRSRGEKLGNIATSVKQIEHAVTDSQASVVRFSAAGAVRDIANRIGAEHPDADIRVSEQKRMWIDINEAFEYALAHAVENAIVHSNDEAPAVEITVGPSPNTGRAEIRVEDTNPPIPPEEIAALFSPTVTTSTSHGSGIGLFVMKWCVESLGGEVLFESQNSGGNAVCLLLPPKQLQYSMMTD